MLDCFGISDVGKVRGNNEDAWLLQPLATGQWLLLVADGVGGRDAGEVASRTTVAVFEQLASAGKLDPASDPALAPLLLGMAAQKAHVTVASEAALAGQQAAMSCTLSVALISDARADLLQVGDSRIYRWHADDLQQLTKDQTVAMQLLHDGRISPAQLATHPDRNTLSQSIGLEASGAPLTPVHCESLLAAGDRLLLCSDGLTDMVPDTTIATLLAAHDTAQAAARALLQAALDAGGKDNVTVLVAKV